MNPEELADFAISQYRVMADKKLTVNQSMKVLVAQVKLLSRNFPNEELCERFLAEFITGVLSLFHNINKHDKDQ